MASACSSLFALFMKAQGLPGGGAARRAGGRLDVDAASRFIAHAIGKQPAAAAGAGVPGSAAGGEAAGGTGAMGRKKDKRKEKRGVAVGADAGEGDVGADAGDVGGGQTKRRRKEAGGERADGEGEEKKEKKKKKKKKKRDALLL